MNYDDSKTRAKNRKKIVKVARDLFIQDGVAHTSIMDIAKKAELERKTFYNYFNDKEEIADYIYHMSMSKFYERDFGHDMYNGLETGYQKIEKYLTTIVEHYTVYYQEMLFAVHYDYYFRKNTTAETIAKIYEEAGVLSPDPFMIEGIEDGSIDLNGRDPLLVFSVIAQSIGAYASRLIFRGCKEGNCKGRKKPIDLDFSSLYTLLEIHLDSIKAK